MERMRQGCSMGPVPGFAAMGENVVVAAEDPFEDNVQDLSHIAGRGGSFQDS